MGRRLLLGAIGAALAMTGTAQAAEPDDRFGFVKGCFTVSDRASGATIGAAGAPFRLQATRLGDYLLYAKDRRFLADPGTGTFTLSGMPSPDAEWSVRGNRKDGWSITNLASGRKHAVRFTEAEGCAVYPEIEVNAEGTPKKGSEGWVDGHMHWTGFRLFGSEFHCGRPWHPYGPAYALPDCKKYDVATNGVARAFLDGRDPHAAYDSVGWPTFGYWPGNDKLSEEGSYWRGIERAWMSGQRILVVDFVDNEALCDVMTVRSTPCHDMESVRIQNRDLEQLEDYIDAQAGGPGEGFMRIVTSPAEAREVVEDGRLAVVKGVELSRILDCGELNGVPQCDREDVDRSLDELWGMGIRSFFPVHKFDNGFGGTKMDGGVIGIIVNLGNHHKTGHWWDAGPCHGAHSDRTQMTTPITEPAAAGTYSAMAALGQGGRTPIYRPGPHCNQRDLTPIGAYLIERMVDRRFLVEIDHMSERTADSALKILEDRRYPGAINSHGGWSSPGSVGRIKQLGGISTFGSDINGLGAQSGPDGSVKIDYPFTSRDGKVTFQKDVWGQRTFDINKDGVAQYGLYADFLERMRVKSGDGEVDNMFDERGAEAYLTMWDAAWSHDG